MRRLREPRLVMEKTGERTDTGFRLAHNLWTFIAAISGLSDETERARLIATGLPSLLPGELSGAALLDEASGEWKLVLQKDYRPVNSAEAERVLAELEPVFYLAFRKPFLLTATTDGTSDARIPGSVAKLGAHRLVVAPLATLHSQLGMLFVGREGPEPFSKETSSSSELSPRTCPSESKTFGSVADWSGIPKSCCDRTSSSFTRQARVSMVWTLMGKRRL